jgi:hypothetical protein
VDRDFNVDVDGGGYGYGDGWGWGGYGVGVATGLVIGAIVNDVPSSGCSTVVQNGIQYQSCNGVLYQPVYSGTTVQYEVVQVP